MGGWTAGGWMITALAVSGCSSESLQLPKMAQFTQPLGGATAISMQVSEPPIDVYSKIARGALRCWFGVEGALKATHTFHARAEPESKGGAAQILVQTRAPDDPNHGALTAYRITIAPAPGGAQVDAENARFSKQQGEIMTGDVKNWLAGADNCTVMGSGGWGAAAPAAEPVKNAEKPKAGKRLGN
ncbi:MAG: hypothetical protein R3D67_03200 [Hyphomicrobiaceae bacterium]